MRARLTLIVALALLVTAPASAQVRLGASTYVQPTQPNAPWMSLGDLWFDTSENRLHILTGMGPTSWVEITTGGLGVPTGAIIFVASGTCPATYTEVSALNGRMVRGTVAANMNVGGTGGADSVTPAGTNQALTFTGSAWTPPAITWPSGVPTNANESAHTHSVTAAGTNGTGTVTPLGTIAWPAGVPTHSGTTATFTGNSNTTAAANTGATGSGATSSTLTLKAHTHTVTPTGTVNITSQGTIAWPAGVPTLSGSSSVTSAEVFTGSSVTSGAGSAHTHTISWPAGVPTIGAFTPAGTINTPTFTGTQFDNRAAYVNLIACSKN